MEVVGMDFEFFEDSKELAKELGDIFDQICDNREVIAAYYSEDRVVSFEQYCSMAILADLMKGYDDIEHTFLLEYKDDFIMFLVTIHLLRDQRELRDSINYFNYESYLDYLYESTDNLISGTSDLDSYYDSIGHYSYLMEALLMKADRKQLCAEYLLSIVRIWKHTASCNTGSLSDFEQAYFANILSRVGTLLDVAALEMPIFVPSPDYFDTSYEVAKQMGDFAQKVNRVLSSSSYLNNIKWMPTINGLDDVLGIMFARDMKMCIVELGHQFKLTNKESFPIYLSINFLLSYDLADSWDYSNYFDYTRLLGEKIEAYVKELSLDTLYFEGDKEYGFTIVSLLRQCGENELATTFINIIYRLCSIVAKADNHVSDLEKRWLAAIYDKANQKHAVIDNELYSDSIIPNPIEASQLDSLEVEDPIGKLNKLVGLSSVKRDVSSLSNLVSVQQMRKQRGMKTTPISYHCVFTGNPGTGKTTVARILADIYKKLGILKRGHLVETDRSGLVADYVGQTATKTNAIIDSALDGVLFIDEAYSLIQGGDNDFGKEAISTLLKRMEDDRDRLIVILAGYSSEMDEFLRSNSGLKSRFSRYIDFPDYSAEEMFQIFEIYLNQNDCMVTESAAHDVFSYIEAMVKVKSKNFGNARFVRNLFERILTQQANRVAMSDQVTVESLSTIELEDVIAAINS